MYRLTHFRATNVIGFLSGMGKKTVDIDLSRLYDKSIIAILGDNGSGKSTFVSLVHPIHTPTDKRSKFIVEGKEGSVVREYLGDDGTCIITRAIYTPKKDGHTAKLFFKVIKPDGEEVELNPSGNVTSYYELVYTYMGVTKDYVTFASYNDLVRSIVDMTDTERKLNVSSLIPNTKRFETTYNIINDKYRDLRNTIRNISQKLTQIESKDVLEDRLKSLQKSLSDLRKDRDKALKKSSKLDGQLKAISGGKPVASIRQKVEDQHQDLITIYNALSRNIREIQDVIFDIDGFESDDLTELIQRGDCLCDKIPKLEVRYAKAIAEKETYADKVERDRKALRDLEAELNELQATMYSLQTQDLDDLKEIKKDAEKRIKHMQYYDPSDRRYDSLVFEQVMALSGSLATLQNIATGFLERYGELFSDSWSGGTLVDELLSDTTAEMDLARMERDEKEIYRLIASKEQFRSLQTILDRRPKSCIDDTCPFIANALEWPNIEKELVELNSQYRSVCEAIDQQKNHIDNVELAKRFVEDNESLISFADRLDEAVIVYTFGQFNIHDIVRDLSNGNTKSYYDCQDILKKCGATLSEKAMYDDIVQHQLPKLESDMQLAKNSQLNRDLISRNIEKTSDKINALHNELTNSSMAVVVAEDVSTRTGERLDALKHLRGLTRSTESMATEFNKKDSDYKALSKTVEQIISLQTEIDEYKDEIRICDAKIKEYEPAVDVTRYQLQQLKDLRLEESVENRRFMVVDIMRSIIQPGKGVWKEAIGIYMSEINMIANQVLMNTFGGELLLEPFELTDKSFFMPYTFNGNRSPDISFASSSQRSTVATAISMAIISKMIDKYSTITLDEFDATLSPANKEIVTEVLINSMKILGIGTAFVITHNPENYEKAAADVGYIIFPGSNVLSGKHNKDYVEV